MHVPAASVGPLKRIAWRGSRRRSLPAVFHMRAYIESVRVDPIHRKRLIAIADLATAHERVSVGMVCDLLWPGASTGAANRSLRRLQAHVKASRSMLRLTIAGPKSAGRDREVRLVRGWSAAEMGIDTGLVDALDRLEFRGEIVP